MKAKTVKVIAILILILSLLIGMFLVMTAIGLSMGITVLSSGITTSFILLALSSILGNQEAMRDYLRNISDNSNTQTSLIRQIAISAEKKNKE